MDWGVTRERLRLFRILSSVKSVVRRMDAPSSVPPACRKREQDDPGLDLWKPFTGVTTTVVERKYTRDP